MESEQRVEKEVALLKAVERYLSFLSWKTSEDINLPIFKEDVRIAAVHNITIVGNSKYCISFSDNGKTFDVCIFSILETVGANHRVIDIVTLQNYPTIEILIQSLFLIFIQYVFRKEEHIGITLPPSESQPHMN